MLLFIWAYLNAKPLERMHLFRKNIEHLSFHIFIKLFYCVLLYF